MKAVEHWQLSIFHHYRIFDDLFHANVFFHNTQKMKLKWGNIVVYQGNLIDAADTSVYSHFEIKLTRKKLFRINFTLASDFLII